MKKKQNVILSVLLYCVCLASCQQRNTTRLPYPAENPKLESPDLDLQILRQAPSLLVNDSYELEKAIQAYKKTKECMPETKKTHPVTRTYRALVFPYHYFTNVTGVLIFVVLILIYFYRLKIHKKEWSQQKEEALNKITALQKDKERKDTRIKQLETIFQAKDIAISTRDAKALQLYLKIIKQKEYIPTADRNILRYWLDISHQNFATRLDEKCPSLTGREKDICYLAGSGFSLDAIAQLLDVQPRSIERYISNICEKFGLTKRSKENFFDFIMAFAHNRNKHIL